MNRVTREMESVFRSILSRKMLRLIFEKYAPSAVVDWDAHDIVEELVLASMALRSSGHASHGDLISVLKDIQKVCCDRRTPERLADVFKDQAKKIMCREECGDNLHNMAAWVLLNDPDTWHRLVTTSSHALSSDWKWFDIPVVNVALPEITQELVDRFMNALSLHLTYETLQGEFLQIEHLQESEVHRFCVSMNNVPKNVQQFEKDGSPLFGRDLNAITFTIEYHPATSRIRMCCPFDIRVRNAIARLFCEHILHGEIDADRPRHHDLGRHLFLNILPVSSSKYHAVVERTGIEVCYTNARGSAVSVHISTEDATSSSETIQLLIGSSLVRKDTLCVTRVFYDLRIKDTAGRTTLNHAVLREDGIHPSCRDHRSRDIVMLLMEECL